MYIYIYIFDASRTKKTFLYKIILDEQQSSSETDHNDGGEGLGEDVAGAAGDSPPNESDAGPFNVAAYRRRLPSELKDERYL